DLGCPLADYARAVRRVRGGWELLVGHALGGAVAVWLAAHQGPISGRLLLVDPALEIADEALAATEAGELAGIGATANYEAIGAGSQRWDDQDVLLKYQAALQVSPFTVQRTFADNSPWHYLELGSRITVPTL